jgi:hypothetical protein
MLYEAITAFIKKILTANIAATVAAESETPPPSIADNWYPGSIDNPSYNAQYMSPPPIPPSAPPMIPLTKHTVGIP